MKRNVASVLLLCFSLCQPVPAFAARWPDPQTNGVEWFYVFGKDGKPTYGAEPEAKEFFLLIPDGSTESIRVRIIDADIQGKHDELDGPADTSTRFGVYSGENLIDSRTVSVEAPDGAIVEIGPIPLDQGELEGNNRVFRVVAEGLEGNDNNLFAIGLEPSVGQLFAFSPSIRLASPEGAKMHFFPEVPAGVGAIRVGNHDLDPDGGRAQMLPPSTRRKVYPLKSSGSAEWAWTTIGVPAEWAGGSRWTYRIIKENQPRANASLRVEDEQGQPLRIYFGPGAAAAPPPRPIAARPLPCNTFLFDASKSYDPDNQTLAYQWDFGDGTTGEGIRAPHTYAKAGTYQAVLTVTDNSTAACRQSKTAQLIRVNTPPQPALNAPQSACAGAVVQMSAADTVDTEGEDLTYRWDFGDGTTAEGAEVTHAYPEGGMYQVRLMVDDGQGTACSTAHAQSAIRVNSSPIAPAGDPVTLCRSAGEALTVAFDGTEAVDPDNDRLSYSWDFGDGQQAEGAKVLHTYEKGGQYTARLLVDDGSGTSCSAAAVVVPVSVNRAPEGSIFREVASCQGQDVTFDAREVADPDGDELRYAWDFGDGETASAAYAQHAYAEPGTYQGTLTVDDGSGMDCARARSSFTVRVNGPPVAHLRADSSACVSQAMLFDATGSSDPQGQRLKYVWDFGDGTTGEGAKARHAYAQGGTYPVLLRVEDSEGTGCSVATAKTEVKVNAPPVADAGRNRTCCVRDTALFDASNSLDPDGDTLRYVWDFGDGTTAEGMRVEHAYQEVGNYPVRLTVSDGSGDCGVSSSGFIATVNGPPVAQMTVTSGGQEI